MHEHLKRRTFAIISHPDAGKTTLTEKLLLFGGAIQMAGAVKGRKATRHATSDWMRLEQERGISVTSSVMQFPYGGALVNLLDTPGHEDFSEDTYRTLTAVDSALMVIDAAKGVEARTIKLMEVCRLRDDADHQLHQQARSRRAAADRAARRHRDGARYRMRADDMADRHGARISRHLSSRGTTAHTSTRIATAAACRTSSGVRASTPPSSWRRSATRGSRRCATRWSSCAARRRRFDRDVYLAGRQTPVFFGAAIHNYGVKELLDAFVDARTAAATARDQRAGRGAGRGPVQRLRVQDSSEHGSRAPRPDRVRPRLLGRIPARHASLPHAPRTRGARRGRDHVHGRRPAARATRRTPATSSGCTTTARSTSATASRRASRSRSPASRASRPSCSAAPCSGIR